MSEEEQNELFKKAFANTLRKLAEEPEELFDNDKLQKKYNNVLKDKIDLSQKLQRIENYLDRQHDIPIELLVNIKNIIHSEVEDEVI